MRKVFAWLGSLDVGLLSAAVAVAAGWAFVAVAYGVTAGSVQAVDEGVLRALRRPDDPAVPLGPPWLAEVGRDLTALGGVAALGLMTAAVGGYLAVCRAYRALAFLLAAVGGGLAMSTLLKSLFDRPRPDVVPHLSHVATASFPSGHSMLAAVVYLTLGALLARLVRSRRLRAYVFGVAVVLAALVGASRVYMGVHYPTDVLAGWSAGLAWAAACGAAARRLRRRGAIEPAAG